MFWHKKWKKIFYVLKLAIEILKTHNVFRSVHNRKQHWKKNEVATTENKQLSAKVKTVQE